MFQRNMSPPTPTNQETNVKQVANRATCSGSSRALKMMLNGKTMIKVYRPNNRRHTKERRELMEGQKRLEKASLRDDLPQWKF
jgi:hypothetical protein